jgi:hypothetical protein
MLSPQTADHAHRAVIHLATRRHAVPNGAPRVGEIASTRGWRGDCLAHQRRVAVGVAEYVATTAIADAIGGTWPSLVGAGVEEGRPHVSASSSSPRRSERQEPHSP